MKKIKYSAFLLFASLLMCIWYSCEDNNSSDSIFGKGELISFGPTGAQLGDTISFIGNGLDKVVAIVFEGDSVPQSAFVSQASTLIKVIAPPNAKKGYVTLRNADGTSVTSITKIDFEVPVTIDTIFVSSPSGAKPGTNITFKGTHLDWVTSVTFFNSTANIVVTDSNFVSVSPSQLVVTVPMTAQTGLFTINTSGTKPLTITTKNNLNIVLPAITNLSPNPILGGKQQLTITGTDLDLVTSILLKGVPDTIKTFVSRTITQIVIDVPDITTPGVVTLIPYSLYPVVSTNPLNVVLPNITNISPNPVARGSNLTIAGTNLDLVTKVVFSGGASPITSFVSQSATQIVVTVPDSAAFGVVTVYSAPNVPVTSPDQLMFVGDINPLPPLAFPIYDNGYKNNAQNWGWGATVDPSNTSIVRVGCTTSAMVTYDGSYGAFWFANYSLSSSSYTDFEFSIYGGPGTDGKLLKVLTNINDKPVWTPYMATIAEGKWTDFVIPLSTFGPPPSITDVEFQDQGWSGVVYFERIGFK